MRKYVEKTVQARTMTVTTTEFFCDECGAALTDETHNELYAALNEGECVSLTRRRDYCNEHIGPIWEAINNMIVADPEQTGHDPADDPGI